MAIAVGQTAPDFTLKSQYDKEVKLSDFKGKKNVVLMFYPLDWSPTCTQEHVCFVNDMKKFDTLDAEVLGVSVDADGDAYHKFVKDHGINFVTVRDIDRKSNNLYGTFKFPETYIIDRNGVVRRKFIGAVDWNSREVMDFLVKISS